MPNRKVGASALAGALTAILVGIAGQLGLVISGELAAAITTVLTFVVGYFVPEPNTP